MTIEERIKKFEEIINVFNEQLETIKNQHDSFYITAGLLTCVGIDTLTGYYGGKQSRGGEFIEFVECYLDDVFKNPIEPGGTKFSEVLYDKFRCGLVHSLSFKKGGAFATSHGLSQYVWYDNSKKTVYIKLPEFIEDFKNACRKYIQKLEDPAHIQLRENFKTRFDELHIL
jgi:hypothetical protein